MKSGIEHLPPGNRNGLVDIFCNKDASPLAPFGFLLLRFGPGHSQSLGICATIGEQPARR